MANNLFCSVPLRLLAMLIRHYIKFEGLKIVHFLSVLKKSTALSMLLLIPKGFSKNEVCTFAIVC